MRTPRVLALGVTTAGAGRRLLDGRGRDAPSARVDAPASSQRSASAPASAPASAAPPRPTSGSARTTSTSPSSMGEIYAQVLENAGYTVERKFGLGSRQERIPTMDAGQIDLVAEYVGSGLGFYDKTKITGDGQANADALQAAMTKAEGHDGPRDHARPGHERVRRPRRHADQHEPRPR